MDKYVEKLREQSIGGVIKYIKLGMLTEAMIPLPEINEQKRIASILDKADSIRRKRQEAIAMAEEFLRSVFLDMFGDPVTNPKGWEVKPFNELCVCSQGIQVDSEKQLDEKKDGYSQFLRIVNYTQNSNDFKHILTPKNDKAKIEKNDIVMVRYGATAGFVGRGLDGYLANNLFKISFDKDILNPDFVYFFLNSDYFQGILLNCRKGGAMPAISFGQLNSINFYVPNYECQEIFSAIYSSIKNCKIKFIESANQCLFESLSQKAFAGEL
jgi:type I restriction enzyme S subunit